MQFQVLTPKQEVEESKRIYTGDDSESTTRMLKQRAILLALKEKKKNRVMR